MNKLNLTPEQIAALPTVAEMEALKIEAKEVLVLSRQSLRRNLLFATFSVACIAWTLDNAANEGDSHHYWFHYIVIVLHLLFITARVKMAAYDWHWISTIRLAVHHLTEAINVRQQL